MNDLSPMSFRLLQSIACFILFALLSGCGNDPAQSGAGPFGPASESRLLAPFAGPWEFDFEKTLAARQAAGASEKEIESIRKMYTQGSPIGPMHPDLTITGNEAVGDGIPIAEYRFFAMHQHGGKVCGKAWHHEDRFDPGDMTKCYVRLKIKDGLLYLEVKMDEESPDLNDPDLCALPPAEGGSPDRCDADAPPGKGWSDWETFVFSRTGKTQNFPGKE